MEPNSQFTPERIALFKADIEHITRRKTAYANGGLLLEHLTEAVSEIESLQSQLAAKLRNSCLGCKYFSNIFSK
jgi:hypothetical protein